MSAPVYLGKSKAEFFPINQPSDGVFSFQGGFPIMQFSISKQDKHLDTSTLRLNGQVELLAPGGAPVTNGINVAATNGIAFNPILGAQSCLNQITLSTQQGQTLETVRSYGRYLVSAAGVTRSQEDMDTVESLASAGISSRSFQGARFSNKKTSFSLPLRTGLLSGASSLPLEQMGGLKVDIELSPDSNTLSGYFTYDASGTPSQQLFNPIGTGATYRLSNVSLTCDLLVLDPQGPSPASGELVYNSISHLYSIVNSSDETKTFNLGASSAVSVFHNFLPTTRINNYSHDGFATPSLLTGATYVDDARIKKVSFLRGGALFPLDYQIDVESSGQEERCQSELQYRFMDAIKPYRDISHSLVSPMSLCGTNAALSGLATDVEFRSDGTSTPLPRPESYYRQAEPRKHMGVGIRFDPISKKGVDFKTASYGVRIESEVDGSNPMSMFSYVVQKNVLSYGPQGISVRS